MAVQNSLTTKVGKQGITTFLNGEVVKNQIEKAIGSLNSQRFITSVVSAVNNNSQLAECTNQSILSGALLGESLNLSPSPQLGHYYLVPFNDKEKGKVATFQVGYKGLLQLAIRSGEYKKINVISVKEGELVKFDALTEDIEINMIEDFETREKAQTIGYYAMFELNNGFRKAIYWSKKQMESHALKYSAGYRAKKGYTFWEKDFDGMAYKTMLRQLISKWGIMSISFQKAYEHDMSVENADGTLKYVDNETDVIDTVASTVETSETKSAENGLFN